MAVDEKELAKRAKKNGMKPAKLLRTLRTGGAMYNKGEIAGFPPDTFEELLDQKIIRPYKEGDVSEPIADVKEKKSRNKSADPNN